MFDEVICEVADVLITDAVWWEKDVATNEVNWCEVGLWLDELDNVEALEGQAVGLADGFDVGEGGADVCEQAGDLRMWSEVVCEYFVGPNE